MRCFLAIELPEPIRVNLARCSDELRATQVRASWVRSEHMHLTLRFFGDIQDDQLAIINEQLDVTVSAIAPFSLSIHGLGAFPTLKKPSILWAGAHFQTGTLDIAQTRCEVAARAAGLTPDTRAFHPHITLARLKEFRLSAELISTLKATSDLSVGEFQATSVSLFESKLTPGGPVHTRLREYRFS